MKTPMNVFNTAMKKKKNRKGFSLVELIVVLVIMAILAAALVPTLIGYIKQTRQSNAKTVASSAFASGDGKYYNQSSGGQAVEVTDPVSNDVDGSASANAITAIGTLAEINKAGGTITKITFSDGVVSLVQYSNGGTNVEYKTDANGKGTYEIVANFS